MTTRHDICFVGLKCYDLLTGAAVPRYLGGIEKLLVSMARGLAARGIKVAFVTYDHGQKDGLVVDGITLYKAYNNSEGLPGVRFFHPRMTKLWAAMRRADAAVYFQMGAGTETGNVALGCHHFMRSKRPFIFSIASDKDADAEGLKKLPGREQALYRYGLKQADLLISQTVKQQQMLERSLGLKSSVMAMPIEAPAGVDLAARAQAQPARHHVLWVGRIIETKRLEFLFEVARRCPEVVFDVVGTPNKGSGYFDRLQREAESVPNVVLHGRVAEGVLPELYRQATLLSCTSILEGFPTTFLEAWSYGVPVVTTFDPDDIVANNGLGRVVSEVDEMVSYIQELTGSKDAWLLVAQRAVDYFNRHYTLDAVLPQFESHCASLVNASAGFSSKS